MVPLLPRGVTATTPSRQEQELGTCLASLGVSIDEAAVGEIYAELSFIIGQWWAEKARLESATVARSLISMSSQLEKIKEILNAHETGFRDGLHVEARSQLIAYTARDSTVGSMDAARK